MLRELRTWAERHGQGLITDRELLAGVYTVIATKWQDLPDSNNDTDVAAFVAALDTIKVP